MCCRTRRRPCLYRGSREHRRPGVPVRSLRSRQIAGADARDSQTRGSGISSHGGRSRQAIRISTFPWIPPSKAFCSQFHCNVRSPFRSIGHPVRNCTRRTRVSTTTNTEPGESWSCRGRSRAPGSENHGRRALLYCGPGQKPDFSQLSGVCGARRQARAPGIFPIKAPVRLNVPQMLSASVSGARVTALRLIGSSGETLQRMEPGARDESADEEESMAPVTPSQPNFRVAVEGRDASGFPYQRVYPTPAESAAVTEPRLAGSATATAAAFHLVTLPSGRGSVFSIIFAPS